MKIRGRGNSTWGQKNKPFQMKLSDKSTGGMPSDKNGYFLLNILIKQCLEIPLHLNSVT